MKVIYFAKIKQENSDLTEDHIHFAFEKLGHEVKRINESNWNRVELINEMKDADLFLFHKAGIETQYSFSRFLEALSIVTCPKVCWYFDKVWGDREVIMTTILPFIDKAFLTDETWIRRNPNPRLGILRQGIGSENTELGVFKKELETEIAFVGQVYGDREKFVKELKDKYGSKFRVFGNIFNRDLYDLMASTKIVVAPNSPSDDFYWSSRVYMILGSGGFLLHPKAEGLKEEFEDKKHLVYYKDFEDLCKKIDFYLKNPKKREEIRMAGYKKCIESFTYLKRCEILLMKLNFGKTE